VDLHDKIPVDILHILEADVPEDTSVIDEDINATEIGDGGANDGLAILDAVVVRHGRSAGPPDLFNDDIGSLRSQILDQQKL
jgi:hypothetical protein